MSSHLVGVCHLRKVRQDAAARLCAHGVSAERDARADVQHHSTGLRPRPNATGTHGPKTLKLLEFLPYHIGIINQTKMNKTDAVLTSLLPAQCRAPTSCCLSETENNAAQSI